MRVSSRTIGISGECDVVEFIRTNEDDGVSIQGYPGLYRIYPVEYKRGKPKSGVEDVMQLVLEAICLEEIFGTTVSEGALFYDKIKRRQRVEITVDMKDQARQAVKEMHHLMKNSLYITNPLSYLTLEGETVVIKDEDGKITGRVPLHNLEDIVSFGYRGMSPALMHACTKKGIMVSFLSKSGRFLARIQGEVKGNVFLREKQYHSFIDEEYRIEIARNCILGKLYNSRTVLDRMRRDHEGAIDDKKLAATSEKIKKCIQKVDQTEDSVALRAAESEAARAYFSVFNEMILNRKDFCFHGRSRRPPMDEANAMLSFVYSLLASMFTGGLETAGLDPYIGCFHVERSGRPSLALDLMEELRPVLADRFVLALINKKVMKKSDFIVEEDGAVLLSEDGRKKLLVEWQAKKKEIITHPFLKEKVEWGLVPLIQARLLASHIRGDLSTYPPFLWR